MKKLLIVLCVVVLAGCGSATKHYLRNNPDAIPVSFTVNLDKEFVKNISTLGGGQAAMLILVGPFTNNAVLLEAKEMIDIGELATALGCAAFFIACWEAGKLVGRRIIKGCEPQSHDNDGFYLGAK